MEVTHVTHNLRIAPRKLRLVTDKIRYMTATQALEMLPLIVNKGAELALKSLKSAIQVAVDRDASADTLVIQRIWSDEGRKLKRSIHRSKGRSLPITKAYSHLSIVLTGEEAVRTRRGAKPVSAEVAPAVELADQPEETKN